MLLLLKVIKLSPTLLVTDMTLKHIFSFLVEHFGKIYWCALFGWYELSGANQAYFFPSLCSAMSCG